MFRNGVRFQGAALSGVILWAIIGIMFGAGAFVHGQSSYETMALEQEDVQHIVDRALAYATVTYVVDDEEMQGVPYLWGGRTDLGTFQDATAGGDVTMRALEGLGLDASGLVVAVLRDVYPDIRFLAAENRQPVLWADATSAILYEYNSVAVEPGDVRAGDLVFFGTRSAEGVVDVGGVGLVTGRSGTRVNFVVASAGQGRIVHTFARTDGDYWRENIIGSARFALPETVAR